MKKMFLLVMFLCLGAFVSSASADELYGYSYWAGHNKKMYISEVYNFTGKRQGNYLETYILERNNAFSKFLEVNGYEEKTYNSSRRYSGQHEDHASAKTDREDTILQWKRNGYSITEVNFQWNGR